jgi:tetratricopeptide (TPR) repeat protein
MDRSDCRTTSGGPEGTCPAGGLQDGTGRIVWRRSPVPPALAALVAAVFIAVPARSASANAARSLTPAPAISPVPVLVPGAVAPDERLRAIVALIDQTRARSAAPGLRDEERDALADLSWAQVDEALEDPLLRERAQRDPVFLRAQARLLMDDGEDEEALGVLERLRTIAPEDPETHRLLALGFMGLGRAQEAVEGCRRALALGSGSGAEVRAHLAYALSVAGRREEGLAESARAIAADPTAYLGHFVRGWILGELGRREEERLEYLEAVRLERDDPDLWAQLARSWEEAGESGRAREAWREVVRIDPSDEDAAGKLKAQP